MLREIIQRRAAVLIEMCDGSLGGILQPPCPACVVEWDHGAKRLDTVVDLWSRDYKSVSREARTSPQHRSAELKDVRITQDPRILPGRCRRRDEHPHGALRSGQIDVFGRDNHAA